MEGKVPQCQDHRQEGSQSNGSGGRGGAGMDEEQASWCVISISGCLRDKHWGAPVRWRCETLPLTDLWCVCVESGLGV